MQVSAGRDAGRVRRLKGRIYVANSEKSLQLDEVSSLAWRDVGGNRRITEIADVVAARYDVDPAALTAALVELFQGS